MSDLSIDKTLSDDSIAEMSTSRVMNRRRTNHDNTQDSMTDYKQKEEANAKEWQHHKKKSFTE